MAAPNPPAGLTITQTATNSPLYELEWTHDGTGPLDRFEVLRRAVGDTTFERVILDTAATFGAGPYSYVVVMSQDTEFVVRALNAAGEVSV